MYFCDVNKTNRSIYNAKGTEIGSKKTSTLWTKARIARQSLYVGHLVVRSTGAVPAMKSEATAIFVSQDGRWKITVSFDGRRFCVPKFRH